MEIKSAPIEAWEVKLEIIHTKPTDRPTDRQGHREVSITINKNSPARGSPASREENSHEVKSTVTSFSRLTPSSQSITFTHIVTFEDPPYHLHHMAITA